jgi:TolB-like protein
MSVLAERLRSRGRVRLRFDSLVVVARHTGGTHAALVADLVAGEVTAMLVRSRKLRIPAAEFVRPYAGSNFTPEEIGRSFNVRGVAFCTIAADESHIDATLELIDVERETLVGRQRFLVASSERTVLARAIVRALRGAGC